MDVQTGELGQDPFDLVVSQLGVMFFDEPTAAFGAIRRPCRTGWPVRLRLLARGRAESVAHEHGVAVLRAAAPHAAAGQVPGRDHSRSVTTSTPATCWAPPGSPWCGCAEFDISVRAPASAVGDVALLRVHGCGACTRGRGSGRPRGSPGAVRRGQPESMSTHCPSGSTRRSTADAGHSGTPSHKKPASPRGQPWRCSKSRPG